MIPDLPRTTPYTLRPEQPFSGSHSLLRPPFAVNSSTGILTCFPSTTRFSLALGADSPCADYRCAGNLGLSADGVFTRLTLLMSAFALLIPPANFQFTFAGLQNAPLPRPSIPMDIHRFGQSVLAPLHLPRRPTRPVSYYAFFKGWLLLSQPPGCLCLSTSFSTE